MQGIRISAAEAEELHLKHQVYCSSTTAHYYVRTDNLSPEQQKSLPYQLHGQIKNMPSNAWPFGPDKQATTA